MTKINVSSPAPSDKALRARELNRAINDLIYTQESNMYINEKKQIQNLIYKLYELGYYKNNISYFKEVMVN